MSAGRVSPTVACPLCPWQETSLADDRAWIPTLATALQRHMDHAHPGLSVQSGPEGMEARVNPPGYPHDPVITDPSEYVGIVSVHAERAVYPCWGERTTDPSTVVDQPHQGLPPVAALATLVKDAENLAARAHDLRQQLTFPAAASLDVILGQLNHAAVALRSLQARGITP